MILRATSFEIGIASMATLLYADCAPWASATNPSHRPLLGRAVLPNSDQSGASVWIISRSGARGTRAGSCGPMPAITTASERIGYWTKCARLSLCSTDRQLAAYPILGGLHHHYVRV